MSGETSSEPRQQNATVSFWAQTATYIVGYMLVLAVRPLILYNQRKASRNCYNAVVVLSLARFVHCYCLIFSDTEGTGNMFTDQGVADLFRTKGDRFVVGLWTEILTLFILLSLALADDGEKRNLPQWCTAVTVVGGFFFAGLGFALHLACVFFRAAGPPPTDRESDKGNGAGAGGVGGCTGGSASGSAEQPATTKSTATPSTTATTSTTSSV